MSSDHPVLDQSVLDRMAGEVGNETLAILIGSLEGEILKGQAEMLQHLAGGEMRLLEVQAHALKSAARSFGALKLGEICLALECGARGNESKAFLQTQMAAFIEAAEETLTALKST